MEFRVLGPLEAIDDSGKSIPLGGPRQRAVLACLLANSGRVVSADQLIEAGWGNNLPQNPKATLQIAVSRLRRLLGPETIASKEPGYVLRAGADDLDSSIFERLVGEATRSFEAGEHSAALERTEEASNLWRGAPFASLEPHEFVRVETHRLEELRARVVEMRLDAMLVLGRHEEALPHIEAALESDPLREGLWKLLMLALYRDGRQAEALRAFARARSLLGEELGIEPGPELREMEEMILLQDPRLEYRRETVQENAPHRDAGSMVITDAPGRPSASDVPNNIETGPTTFVGREAEIASLVDLVTDRRLVTLTGPGGVGKTSIARQVAIAASHLFPAGGVWMAELASLTDPRSIPPTVAHALGLEFDSERTVDQILLEWLARNPLLLIIDNCEHLIDASADYVAAWLAAAPELHVMATSREPLAVKGEIVYKVPALVTPSLADANRPEAISRNESVRLLMTRIAEVSPEFELSASNARDIAKICQRLDGIPLALELAASRFSILTAAEIASRLDDRFDLLTSRQRGLPARQRTLEAALAWSYDLLTDEERDLLTALSVFRGGFDMEAVRAVCGEARDVFDRIESLAAKSLVAVRPGEDRSRYTLLESVQVFASDHLSPSRKDELMEAHARYYSKMATRLGPEVWGHEGTRAIRRLSANVDNIRAALRWCLQNDPRDGLGAVAAAGTYWQAVGLIDEGMRTTEQMIAVYDGDPDSRLGGALNTAGMFRYHEGNKTAAKDWWRRSLEISLELGDGATAARAASNLGVLASDSARYDEAAEHYEFATRLFEELGDHVMATAVLGNLGVMRLSQGDVVDAVTTFESYLELARRARSRREEARAMMNLGDALRFKGDLETAEEHLRMGLALAQESGHSDYIPAGKHSLAALLVETGHTADAACYAHEGLTEAMKTDPSSVADLLDVLAQVAIHRGHLETAAALLGAAEETGHSDRMNMPPSELENRRARVENVKRALGQQFASAYVRGKNADENEILQWSRSLAPGLDDPGASEGH